MCHEHKIQAVLPLGGGSTFDSAKAIAFGAKMPKGHSFWEALEGTYQIKAALPIYGCLTISATASEMDNGGVI